MLFARKVGFLGQPMTNMLFVIKWTMLFARKVGFLGQPMTIKTYAFQERVQNSAYLVRGTI